MVPSPIHIIIPGRPLSFQSRGPALREWKQRVSAAARFRVRTLSSDEELAVCITHFYLEPPRCDTDNMSKPICDAMNNVVYRDDWQIAERLARRIPIGRSFDLHGMPPELAVALCKGREFVYVRVSTTNPRATSPIR